MPFLMQRVGVCVCVCVCVCVFLVLTLRDGPLLAETATSATCVARPRYGAGLFCFDCVKLCNVEHLMGVS